MPNHDLTRIVSVPIFVNSIVLVAAGKKHNFSEKGPLCLVTFLLAPILVGCRRTSPKTYAYKKQTCRRNTPQKVQLPLRPMCVTIWFYLSKDTYTYLKVYTYVQKRPIYMCRDLSPEDPAKSAVALTANVCDDLVCQKRPIHI